MNITVSKFGGTSMGTAISIESVVKILTEKLDQNIAVVSATSGTTETLIKLGKDALGNKDFYKELENLKTKHINIIEALGIDIDLSLYFEEIHDLLKGIALLKELSKSSMDRLMGFGERISSEILASKLNAQGTRAIAVDAFNLVFTDNEFGSANVDFEKTNKETKELLMSYLENGIMPIVTGFVGQSGSGQYITLGRGGSDYTGAIVASALDANNLEIWTDVDGIFNADPRYFENAKIVEKLSFEEASELAYFGAKVLHPKTIKPAIAKNIPVRILNTFNTNATGTVITNESNESLKSVTYKKGVSIVNICSIGMLDAFGFLAKIFDIFREGKVVIDVLATSEVSVSLTVENDDYKKILPRLKEFATTNVYENMAIICLVGNGIQKDTQTLSRLFSSVKLENISMVSQGASQRNITFVIDEANAKQAVENIFNEFFNN